MSNLFITIVHNANNSYCKLLVIILDSETAYYSKNREHNQLIYFLKPTSIEIHPNKLVLSRENQNKEIRSITVSLMS